MGYLDELKRQADEARARNTVDLAAHLPVYVTYFTADVSDAGAVEYHDDIYGRDAGMGDSRNPASQSSG